jgi:hypothetical protein
MATALFIKTCDMLTSLELDQIPELPKDDIERYSNKYLLVFQQDLETSIETLPEKTSHILNSMCTNFKGIRIGVSEEVKGKVTLFVFVRAV